MLEIMRNDAIGSSLANLWLELLSTLSKVGEIFFGIYCIVLSLFAIVIYNIDGASISGGLLLSGGVSPFFLVWLMLVRSCIISLD